MIVRRAMKNSTVVPGGGAIDVCKFIICKHYSRTGHMHFSLKTKINFVVWLPDGDKQIPKTARPYNCGEVPVVY
jgi:hypothetical protein